MLSLDAVARGDHVGVYHQLPQSPAPHHHLRLLIGQTLLILSIEGDGVGEHAAV